MKRSNVIKFPVRGVNRASSAAVYTRVFRAEDSKQCERQFLFCKRYWARIGIKLIAVSKHGAREAPR